MAKKITFQDMVVQALVLSLLYVDEAISRSYSRRRVESIRRDLCTHAVGVLIVTPREGRYAVIDGAKRLAALRQKGATEWLCIIVPPLTNEEACRVKYYTDGQHAPASPRDQFRLAYFGHMTRELNIWDVVVTAFGYHIPLDRQEGKLPRSITTYKALTRIYDDYGGKDGLASVFRVITDCFLVSRMTRQPQLAVLTGPFMMGLAFFLYHTQMTTAAVCHRLGLLETRASEIVDEAKYRMREQGICGHERLLYMIAHVFGDMMTADAWATNATAN